MGSALRRKRKRLKRWFVYQVVRFVAATLSLLPLSWIVAFGGVLGRFARRFDGVGRRRAEAQLAERLGVDARTASALAAEVYENAGRVAAEIAVLPRLLPRLPEYVHLPDEDLSVLRAALAEGKGVIFVTGHIGNWELLAQRVVHDGFDGVTLARSAPNPFLGDWIVRRRALGGLQTINRGDPRAARSMLAAMRRGALLGVLLDQDTKVPSVHVPFFGADAATPVAAAELALRRGAPIVVGFIRRRAEGGGHEVRLERFQFEGAPDAAKAERVRALTAALTARIEAAIRERPAEWVWFHARWRTSGPSGGSGQPPARGALRSPKSKKSARM